MVFGSSACQFKVLDIERISERLFEQEKIREKLCRNFCIEDVGDPVKMANRLVNSMGQITPRDDVTEDLEDKRTVVFRAAALALASNMRQWSRVLNCLGKFESLLEQYDPAAFSREVDADCARIRDVEDCLGGQTARSDAAAIVKWAAMLEKNPGYLNALNKLKSDMEARIHDGEVVPVLAAFLGSPPTKRMRKRWPPPSGMESWKVPGMGMPLASEFLRNLHWEGFKPDRHIKRLIGRWFPEVVESKFGRASYLAREILHVRLERRDYRVEILSGRDGSYAERLQFHEGRQSCLGARGVCREEEQGVGRSLLEDHRGVGVCRRGLTRTHPRHSGCAHARCGVGRHI